MKNKSKLNDPELVLNEELKTQIEIDLVNFEKHVAGGVWLKIVSIFKRITRNKKKKSLTLSENIIRISKSGRQ